MNLEFRKRTGSYTGSRAEEGKFNGLIIQLYNDTMI